MLIREKIIKAIPDCEAQRSKLINNYRKKKEKIKEVLGRRKSNRAKQEKLSVHEDSDHSAVPCEDEMAANMF